MTRAAVNFANLSPADREESLDRLIANREWLALLRLSSNRSRAVRLELLERLDGHSTPVSLPISRALVTDPDDMVRQRAVEILGDIGNRLDITRLKIATADKAWTVRSSAVESLAAKSQSADALRVTVDRLLRDPHFVVRRDAAIALGYAFGEIAVSPLRDALSQERHEIARAGILYGLYVAGQDGYLSTYIEMFRYSDLLTRNNLVHFIEVDDIRQEDRAALAAALSQVVGEDLAGLHDDVMALISRLSGVA